MIKFSQRLRRLEQWSAKHLSGGVAEMVKKLCRRRAEFTPAYDCPQAARTSNGVDRLLNHLDRLLCAACYGHSTPGSLRLAVRAMALQLKSINQLNSAHKSGDAWVCIASSVQAWIVVHWEDPQRLWPIRIPARLITINAPPAEDCTLEAAPTQACANQCMDFRGLLFAQSPITYL